MEALNELPPANEPSRPLVSTDAAGSNGDVTIQNFEIDVNPAQSNNTAKTDLYAEQRRLVGQKVLEATLALAEPAPPPEARKPSTATKWVVKPIRGMGGTAMKKVKVQSVTASVSKSKPKVKRPKNGDVADGEALKSAIGSVTAALNPPLTPLPPAISMTDRQGEENVNGATAPPDDHGSAYSSFGEGGCRNEIGRHR